MPLFAYLYYYWVRKRRQRIRKFGDEKLVKELIPDYSKARRDAKFWLFAMSFVCLCIAWANPQWGLKKEKVNRRSADILIALDVSKSMLAQDLMPNRLERAKQLLQRLVTQFKTERVGIINFAGTAYLQVPLTNDYNAINLLTRSVTPDQAPAPGTAIADAIKVAQSTFDRDKRNHKALI